MADQEPNGGGNGADNGQPQVGILAQYVKDLSVENPNAPEVYSVAGPAAARRPVQSSMSQARAKTCTRSC